MHCAFGQCSTGAIAVDSGSAIELSPIIVKTSLVGVCQRWAGAALQLKVSGVLEHRPLLGGAVLETAGLFYRIGLADRVTSKGEHG